jgi:hypothetical protein
MANGMGRDRGAALILEQAVLPATVPDEARTRAFAWYNVLQDAGGAIGGLVAAVPAVLRVLGAGELESVRIGVGVYALLTVAPVLLYRRLSPAVDVVAPDAWGPASGARPDDRAGPLPGTAADRQPGAGPPPAADRETGAGTPPAAAARLDGPRRVSPESRRVLARISALFALDSLGGGFLTTALLAFFFHERFGADEAAVGALFFGSRALNALSHLGAAWLARRIGLVNTMVFTHIPSSLLLVTVPFAPSFPVAAALFLLREGLVEMDVPTRQSYVMAVVRPAERTFASGLTHLVRLGAWAVAPAFAGLFMRGVSLATPLYVGAGMKVAYDLLLWLSFRRLRPPEERAPGDR